MILEVAILYIKKGHEEKFKLDFIEAGQYISSNPATFDTTSKSVLK